MNSGLSFLTDLPDDDIAWMLEVGHERQVIANTILLKEGARAESLIFVLNGLVGVRVSFLEDQQVATLGPGEMLGEMGFIEERPASATVLAVENSLLLIVPYQALREALESRPGFGARFHRAVAMTISRRLREREREYGRLLSNQPETEAGQGDAWGRIASFLEGFKKALQESDRAALENGGQLPEERIGAVSDGFHSLVRLLEEEIGDRAELQEAAREHLGARVQREVLPYLLLTRSAERLYSKPRGYAGDFQSIDWIYANEAGGTGRLGPALDRCFLDEPAAQAVRNRRGLLRRTITRLLERHRDRPVRIVSMACGPAREIFDVLDELGSPERLDATLIDIDPEALEQVREEIERRGVGASVRTFEGNLIYLAMGRQKIELEPQDLMYSIGLIDYFNDKLVSKLMSWGHRSLAPGGELVLGNFHPKNPDKALMDYVLDWRLTHRNEADMNRLFQQSAFGRACTRIEFEASGVNLFATCERT